MILRYEKEKMLRILYPKDIIVEKGTELETDDTNFIKDLKELGFKEVKTKKEGGK